jgi:hypothetical protein
MCRAPVNIECHFIGAVNDGRVYGFVGHFAPEFRQVNLADNLNAGKPGRGWASWLYQSPRVKMQSCRTDTGFL